MNKPDNKKQTVAIVGGGMMGLALAFELSKNAEFQITLFEKQPELGGLSSFFQWNEIIWDKYYHVILSTDKQMIEFLEELGLDKELYWRETQTGFYGEGRLVSLSSTLDFIKFPFMTLWQKFRMGLGIFYSTLLKDPAPLDKIYVKTWLTKVFGRRVYEKIWEPLLRSKLGEAREKTSAAFIWATITRLYGARDKSSKIERMGHIPGGYHRIIQTAEEKLREKGVTILKDTSIKRIEKKDLSTDFQITTRGQTSSFNKVIMTAACPEILNIVKPNNQDTYWKNVQKINYLGVTCVVLILKKSLSPYYVINLLDKKLPFTGVIEATNVISPKEVGGYHLVYLPKYAPSDDTTVQMDNTELTELFLHHLKSIFPDLADDDIVHSMVFRDPYVQPLQELYSLENAIDFQTPTDELYICNTSMILNSTLNNNAVLELARKATIQSIN